MENDREPRLRRLLRRYAPAAMYGGSSRGARIGLALGLPVETLRSAGRAIAAGIAKAEGLTPEDARELSRGYLRKLETMHLDALQMHWGHPDPQRRDSTMLLPVWVDDETWTVIDAMAERLEMPATRLMEEVLRDGIEERRAALIEQDIEAERDWHDARQEMEIDDGQEE